METANSLKLEGEHRVTTKCTVFEDNNGAISMATTPRLSPRTKHVACKYHFFKQFVGTRIGIEKVNSDAQLADMLTKGLDALKFATLRKGLLGW